MAEEKTLPMAEKIAKAELRQVEWHGKDVRESGRVVPVQFNPESLKVSFTNQVSGGDQGESAAVQFIAKSTTKLAVDLWFDGTVDDTGRELATPRDVRKLTEQVALFMKPDPDAKSAKKKKKPAPPGVRFLWGTFLFDGVMESMSESLEYFSEEGVPLRSKVSISLSSQDIQFEFDDPAPSNVSNPGLVPRQGVKQGDTVQDVSARNGDPDGWRSVAEANDVDDPLRPSPGSRLAV